jgi:hypothetical protein
MNKTALITLLIVPIFFVGCAANQKTETPPVGITQENNIFDHSLFSLKLPAPYTETVGIIQAKNENDFSQIIFDVSSETVESDKLLELEETGLNNMCSQTESCGKIISHENIIIGGNDGIKFTVQYQGRGVEDVEGYINEFHYSILSGGNLIRFWTSASDLANGEMVEKGFDEIIKTISFK